MTDQTLGEWDGLAKDRADFRATALNWAKITRVPWSGESADAELNRLREIAIMWARYGQLRGLLEPLLDDPQLPVRTLAATHLWRHGVDDVEPLLRQLAALDDPSTRPAEAALRMRTRTP